MADGSFFGGLSGVRMPETVMNAGPLPPLQMSGMPYGLNGVSDARINEGSALLGDIEPYAYGEPSHLSTQSSYINIPNRIQKVVPVLHVPGTTNTDDRVMLTHAVDDGDVCFALRDRHMKLLDDAKGLERMYSQRNYHPFVNLATVNYLLAGLQIYQITQNELPATWRHLYENLTVPAGKQGSYPGGVTASYHAFQIVDMLETCFVPFGVAHGSEKQGGGHEGSNGPVTWASNFVTTMYIDGHVRNLANLWRGVDVSAGQHLVFQLQLKPLPKTYTLNHYQKATVRQSFTERQRAALADGLETTEPYVMQLVPDVVGSDTFVPGMPYWRIVLPHSQSRKYHSGETFHDDSVLLSGALLEGSFQPVFCWDWNIDFATTTVRDMLFRIPGVRRVNGHYAGGFGQQLSVEPPFKRYARDCLNRPERAPAAVLAQPPAPTRVAAPVLALPLAPARAAAPVLALPLAPARTAVPGAAEAAAVVPAPAPAPAPAAAAAVAPEPAAAVVPAPEPTTAAVPAPEPVAGEDTVRKQAARKRAQGSALGSALGAALGAVI